MESYTKDSIKNAETTFDSAFFFDFKRPGCSIDAVTSLLLSFMKQKQGSVKGRSYFHTLFLYSLNVFSSEG